MIHKVKKSRNVIKGKLIFPLQIWQKIKQFKFNKNTAMKVIVLKYWKKYDWKLKANTVLQILIKH